MQPIVTRPRQGVLPCCAKSFAVRDGFHYRFWVSSCQPHGRSYRHHRISIPDPEHKWIPSGFPRNTCLDWSIRDVRVARDAPLATSADRIIVAGSETGVTSAVWGHVGREGFNRAHRGSSAAEGVLVGLPLFFNKRCAVQRLRFFRGRVTPCCGAAVPAFTKELYRTHGELSAAFCAAGVVKPELAQLIGDFCERSGRRRA